MKNSKAAKKIMLIEKLRLIESELFSLSSKYGVKTIEDMNKFIAKGKLSEEIIGEDLFVFDHLLSEKSKLEQELSRLKIKKSDIWQSLQNLLKLPKLEKC